MTVRLIAFTGRGEELARSLGRELPGEVSRCGESLTLADWTERAFREADGLIFVGAAGIAVRAIAPYLRGKSVDPAVVAVDEAGQFAVPLLSGHLGGANDLARRVAALCGATPVITTATDIRGAFAVDEWARRQGCAVRNPEWIKSVSAALLSGGTVRIGSDWLICGTPPEGVQVADAEPFDAVLSIREGTGNALRLIPRIAVLGVGCRRGIRAEELETAFEDLCKKAGICKEAFSLVCSLDRKAEEPGLLDFCRSRSLPLRTFSAEELQSVPGGFTSSGFVRSVTGVDNVCERSAVKGSGGTLLVPKTAGNGITMAAAVRPFAPDWRWQYG